MGEVGTLTWMDPSVAEVNRFRNHFIGQSESLGSHNDKVFYNVRGNSGVVLVSSTGPCDVSISLGGKMKDGTYTDQVTGNKFTVSGGTIKGSIKSADGIAVVYNTTTVPRNTIEAPRENFAYESIDIEIGLNNATSGTYSLNGGTATTYTGTKKITIGAGDPVGTQYKLTLTATDGKNTTAGTFTFTKEAQTVEYPTDPVNPPTEPQTTVPTNPIVTNPTNPVTPTGNIVLYFDNSAYNWSEVYAYVYDDSVGNVAAWPGTKMQYDSKTGYHFFEVPAEYANGRVLFTESYSASTNRYPADGQPGMEIGGSSKLFGANHSWTNYTAPTEPTTAPPTTVPTPTYQIGDVDKDGTINIRDATTVQLFIAKYVAEIDLQLADFDGSGVVDIRDATAIQMRVAGLI